MRAVIAMVLLILAPLIQRSLSHPTNVETSLRVRLLDPPGRASLGLMRPGCNLTRNHEDDKLYCGDYFTQHNRINRGRCGICGDPWAGAHPHQAGGLYASGTIAKSYKVGQVIEVVTSVLFAETAGFFTFALCPHNDSLSSPDPECFAQHRLTVTGHLRSGSWGEYVWTEPGDRVQQEMQTYTVQLPSSLSCSQCILQYTYTASEHWGAGPQSASIFTRDCMNLTPRLGCGNQVQFRGCSDICIGDFCPEDPFTCLTVEDIKEDINSV